MSRICLAPQTIFHLPVRTHEDARLSNGLFLADLAEVRQGATSHACRAIDVRLVPYFRPQDTMIFVASERTLSVQIKHNTDSQPQLPGISRHWLLDMINLYALQAQPVEEIALRKRHFRRLCVPRGLRDVLYRPAQPITEPVLRDAAKTVQLLVPGIDVEEEVFSLNTGVQTVLKRLQYDPVKRVLHVFVPPSCDDDNTNLDEEKKAATFVDSSDEEDEGPIGDDKVDVEGIVVFSLYPTSLDLLCSFFCP